MASEDLEVVLHIQRAGWEIWYNPAMVVYHRIPNSRLQKEYLLSLVRCVGLSRYYIRMLGLKSWQKPLAFPVYIANDLRKLVLHKLKYRSILKTDIANACERQLLLSTLKSPFFLWRKQVFRCGTNWAKLSKN